MLWDICPVAAIAAVCLTPTPLSIFTGPPVVNLRYASYQGTLLSSGVNQYLGMRYAVAPIGDLRFRAPILPHVMPGLQLATSVGLLSPPLVDGD